MINKPSIDIEKIQKEFKQEMETLFCNGKLEGYEFDSERSCFYDVIELRFNKGNEHYKLNLMREQLLTILSEYRIYKDAIEPTHQHEDEGDR